MRAIDADKIMADIASAERSTPKDYTLLSIARYISIQPTIEAEPIRHGKWIEQIVITDKKAIEEWQSARCSVCGKIHTTPYMYYFSHYDYCPHCGCKMDLDEVEE